jgi:hypothetical protein
MKLFLVFTICLFHFLIFGNNLSGCDFGFNNFLNIDAGLDVDRLKYEISLIFNPILVRT